MDGFIVIAILALIRMYLVIRWASQSADITGKG